MTPTLYEEMGGEGKVRAVTDCLVERMMSDLMIGFFFSQTPARQLKELEFQHAAAFLGGPVVYRGRPLDAVHRPRNIAGGHFARRKQILKEVLEELGVPPTVRQAWLAHQESLRRLVTGSQDDGCDLGQAKRT